MSNPQHPSAPKTKGFDLWCSQLELTSQHYGSAWAQLGEALREYRSTLLAANNSSNCSRLPEFTQEYLAIVRRLAELIEKGPADLSEELSIPLIPRERRLACRYPVKMD